MRKIRIAGFCSHYWGAAAFDALASLSHWLDVVWIATDDPLKPFTNAKGRLWSLGWDEELRHLVSNHAGSRSLTANTDRVRTRAVLDSFIQASPDAILCCCYGQRIPESLLDFVYGRAINLHPTSPGLGLEATRGPRGMELAMKLGDFVDVSAHRMSSEFDVGEVFVRSVPHPIHHLSHTEKTHPKTVLQLYKDTAYSISNLVCDHLLGILATDLLRIVDQQGEQT